MKKTLIAILITITVFLIPKYTTAETIFNQSATLSYNNESNLQHKDYTIKKIVINKILTIYNSPLKNSTEVFVKACFMYNFDCYLLPSITGLESYFGKYVLPNSYNPFGWGGGYIIFKNWDDAITTVAYGIKNNYINKGADTIEKIAPIYAESNTWAARVNYFKKLFDNEEQKTNLLLGNNEVEL